MSIICIITYTYRWAITPLPCYFRFVCPAGCCSLEMFQVVDNGWCYLLFWARFYRDPTATSCPWMSQCWIDYRPKRNDGRNLKCKWQWRSLKILGLLPKNRQRWTYSWLFIPKVTAGNKMPKLVKLINLWTRFLYLIGLLYDHLRFRYTLYHFSLRDAEWAQHLQPAVCIPLHHE